MGVILYPLMGEKAVNLREKNNTLLFAVDIKATKKQIKEELEKDYKMKIIKINTVIIQGMKKVYAKLMPEYSAVDIASRFGTL